MAERLLTADLAAAGVTDVVVTSAGTHARTYGYVGRPMDPRAEAELRRRRLPGVGDFRSRELQRAYATAADLVLTADRAHRDAVVALEPGAARRAFTLREFAFLLADIEGVAGRTASDRGAELTRLAANARGLRRPDRPADFDLPDPVDADPAGFTRCADHILAATGPLVDRLARPAPEDSAG